jgi:hypothetical protein
MDKGVPLTTGVQPDQRGGTRMTIRFQGTLWMILIACAAVLGQEPDKTAATYDYDLESAPQLRMELSAGEYRIEGSPDDKLRVTWSSTDPKESTKTTVRFSNEHGIAKLETDHTKNVKVVIQVPRRSDLYVRLSAGELRVSGIEGHKDIGISAGELRIHVGDPAAYRDVHSSVRIGEIHADAFHVTKEGFFRNFTQRGTGNYSLSATVGVGEVVLTN